MPSPPPPSVHAAVLSITVMMLVLSFVRYRNIRRVRRNKTTRAGLVVIMSNIMIMSSLISQIICVTLNEYHCFVLRSTEILLRLVVTSLLMEMKKALRETQTLRAACSKAEPKIFAPPQIPFPGAQDGQNLISWRWSLPLPTDSVW